MRVGFVTQLLWDRYGPFWRDLVAGAGAEPTFPEPEAVRAAYAALPEDAAPSAPFRLALAQAAALEEADLLVLPRLNPEGASERGAGTLQYLAPEQILALGDIESIVAYLRTWEKRQ